MPKQITSAVLATRSCAVALAWCCAAASASAATPLSERYEGLAHARTADKRLVYRETHWLYMEAGVRQHLVLYSCPDGTPFARKRLRESPSADMPDFDFHDARDGYREGVRGRGANREIYVQASSTAAVQTKPLPSLDGAVIDAGFDAYVRGHWSALTGGQGIKVPFLIPSRFDYLDFTIANARDAVIDGLPVRRLRMKLSAWYGFVVPAIDLAYERDGSRLVEFQGIGTIRDTQGRHEEVRIDFPLRQRTESPAASEIAQAIAQPLAQACPSEHP